MSESLGKFVKDSSWSFIALLVTAISQFILRVILARYYGAGDLGLYTLAFTVYSFGLVISSFGIDMGLIKYVAEAQKLEKDDRSLLVSGNITSFLIGCLMFLLLYFASPIISSYFFKMPELTNLLRIVSIVFPFLGLEKSIFGYLTGTRRIQLLAWLTVIQSVITIILTVISAYLGWSVDYTVWGFILPIVLISLISLIFVRKSISWPGLNTLVNKTKILLSFGLYIVMANGLGVIQVYTGTMLIGYFMTDSDVGLYSAASIVIQAFFLAPSSVQRITSAMFAGYWAKNEVNKIERLVNQCMKYGAIYGIFTALLTGFLSHEIVGFLFGKALVAASLPLQILLIGALFAAIYQPIGGILANTDFVKIVFRITGLTVVLNLLLNLTLIPTLKLPGSAIASIITSIVFVFTQLYYTQKLTRIKIEWVWFVKLLGFAVLTGSAIWLSGRFINNYISITVGLVFVLLVMVKWFLNNEDRRVIKSVIRMPVDNNNLIRKKIDQGD